MGATYPHDHYCPYCEERVECEAAQRDDVGCLFPGQDMTCEPCAEEYVRQLDARREQDV